MDFDIESANFREYYGNNIELLRTAANSFAALITSLLSDNNSFSRPVVTYRVKDREECISKFARKYQSALEKSGTPYEIRDHLTDLIGLRVTCYYENDVSHIEKLLRDNFETIDVTNKTSEMESRDDTFGYKGLHLDLKLGAARTSLPEYKPFELLRFEIQVRTIIQNAWSELDHKIKYKKNTPTSLKRRIHRLAALFELADQEFINIKVETDKREEESKAEAAASIPVTSSVENDPLDAFRFAAVLEKAFPNYDFLPYKVDGFLEEIRDLNPDLTTLELRRALDTHLTLAKEYAAAYHSNNGHRLNPYTVMRHVLYLYNEDKFRPALFAKQRTNFNEWIEANNPRA